MLFFHDMPPGSNSGSFGQSRFRLSDHKSALVDAVIFLCYDLTHGKSAQGLFGLIRSGQGHGA